MTLQAEYSRPLSVVDMKFRLCLHTDQDLILIIIRSVKTAIVQINLHFVSLTLSWITQIVYHSFLIWYMASYDSKQPPSMVLSGLSFIMNALY